MAVITLTSAQLQPLPILRPQSHLQHAQTFSSLECHPKATKSRKHAQKEGGGGGGGEQIPHKWSHPLDIHHGRPPLRNMRPLVIQRPEP